MNRTTDRYMLCPVFNVQLRQLALQAAEGEQGAQRSGRGRPPTPSRKVMNSIWYRLCTGCQWKAIPEGEHLCNGTTAHRWFRRLVVGGVFEVVHAALVALYVEHGLRKLHRAGIDCTLVPVPLGGAATGANPTDRGKPGVKISIVVDRHGRPLAIHVDKANRHDIRLLGPTLANMAQEVLRRLGANPELVAGKGYDYQHVRAEVLARGFRPCFLRRGTKYPKARKRHRWLRAVTERTHAHMLGSRRFAPSGSARHVLWTGTNRTSCSRPAPCFCVPSRATFSCRSCSGRSAAPSFPS